ncbi:MAG: translocation/assembly module TamB domain-containing protein [Deltaproteobacteria bacterium]|nr:translocation/assembly module TamB domain-containing protein [Deltaproteobacteria bacterium]
MVLSDLTRTWRRILKTAVIGFFRFFFWTLLAFVALAASLFMHLHTDLARKVAGRLLTSFVSGEIRGTLTIGRVDQLRFDRLVASDVALFDPEGHRIAVADEVILIPDTLFDLFNNRLRFKSATLRGATVRLLATESGLPTFLETFEPTDTSESSSEPIHAVVENIRLSQVVVYGDFLELNGLRVQEVSARGRLEVKEELKVEITSAKGVFVRPFPFKGYVDDLTGSISSNANRGIALEFKARQARDRADISLKLFRPPAASEQAPRVSVQGSDKSAAAVAGQQYSLERVPPQWLELRVQGSPISPETIRGMGFTFTGPFRSALSGSFSLVGPLDELELHADLKSDAGDGVLSGAISQTRGVSVTLRTPGIKLDRVFEQAPALTLSGSAVIALGPQQTNPRVQLQVEPVIYQTIAIPSFELDAELEPKRLRIDEILSREEGSEISGHGAIDFDGRIDLTMRARISEIGRDPNIRRHVPGSRGKLDAELHVVTPGFADRQMSFQGRVTLRDLRYGALSAKRLSLNGSARGEPDLPQVNLKVAGEAIAISDFSIGDTEFNLRGGPREYAASGRVRVKGQQSFLLDARINADKEGFVLNAEQIELFVGERSWRGTARNLKLIKDKLISLELLRLASQTQRLETQATIRFHGSDEVKAQLQDFDLAVLHTFFGKRFYLREGRADANLQLTGDLRRPALSVQGALRDGVLFKLKDVNGVFVVSYQNGGLEIDAEADLGKRGTISVTGNGLLDSDRASLVEELLSIDYNLMFRANDVDLALGEQILGKAARAVAGRLGGELNAVGTLEQPSFSGKLKFDPLAIEGVAPLSIDSAINFQRDRLEIECALGDARGAIGNIKGNTSIKSQEIFRDFSKLAEAVTQGPWAISGYSTRRRLDSLPSPVSQSLPWPIDLQTRFKATQEGGKTYVELWFDGQWTARFEGTECAAEIRPSLSGQVVLYDDNTHFTASAFIAEQRFAEIEGTARTPVEQWIKKRAFTGVSALSGIGEINISSIESFPWLCEYGSGSLRAKVDVDELLTEHSQGRIDLTTRFFPKRRASEKNTRRRQPVTQTLSCEKDPFRVDLDVVLNPKDLELSGVLSGCGSSDSRVKAHLPIKWINRVVTPELDRERELNAEISFEQAELKPILEHIDLLSDAQGSVQGSISARGKPGRVRLSGRAELSRGEFQLASTGQRFSEAQGSLLFHGNWIEVQKLTARDGKGLLRLSGGIGLEEFVPKRVRLALFLDDFPVQRENVPLAWLSGTASIESEIMQHRAVTSLFIESLDVLLPETSTRSLQSLDAHPDIQVIGVEKPVAQTSSAYAVQFNVDGSHRLITVRRSDFSAAVEAELDVIYLDPELRVAGDIEFKRGVFEAFGKKFDLNEGSLFFDGSPQLNPKVSLKATHKPYGEDSGSVVVTVFGTMRRPEVTFYSDECQGEEGALTMLVTGSCSLSESEMANQDASAQREAFIAGAAGGILTLGTTGIRREMNDLLPTFSVGTYGGAQDEKRYRVQAGVNADSLIPQFIRPIVRHAYLQGGLTASSDSSQQDDTATDIDPEKSTPAESVDFLLELRFPFDFVWTGQVSPPQKGGFDITWEP